ncbi:MAG TPA: SusD/RagB family nutrient-binding outer membrane lipoprotein [Bacteroidales bacterium]|nr:SusD/RagB family nutrient-binding outer membrane lipoprotein [Bacteroidales bacterium]
MKSFKILLLTISILLVNACSEDKMDEINQDVNNALQMSAQSELPDVILKTSVETTATDIAWYATVYIEHSVGTWGQSNEAEKRIGQEAGTVMNNSWNNLYDVLMILDDIMKKTDPDTGDEVNPYARAIAQILTAYNLAVLTDMWGEVPWTDAIKGSEMLQPTYDKQSTIYPKIITLLNDGIATMNSVATFSTAGDYIYGGSSATAKARWIKAANSLKARYSLRLTNVDNSAATKALAAVSAGFANSTDNLSFARYEATATGENPWFQFLNDRSHLSSSKTLYDLMTTRVDPRIPDYFLQVGGVYNPAPNGTATQTQGGIYSTSAKTASGRTAATPLMTYHELKFIEAEAKFRTSDATWQTSLQQAIEANFAFCGLTTAAGTAYFNTQVVPLLTAGNELKEILTQKYIALYEYEAIEAYNDYRREPSFLTLNNPFNASVGFVWRFAYPTSEESSNSANIPDISIYSNKVWWAGGSEN